MSTPQFCKILDGNGSAKNIRLSEVNPRLKKPVWIHIDYEDYDFKNGANIDNIIIGDIETKKLVTKKEEFKVLDYKQRKAAHSKNKSTQNEGLLSRFKGFINYKALNQRN